MTEIGTEANPLRVAIIGAGPTGFYATEHLFRQNEFVVEVDLIERLPTPYGLVRYGVAPDHQKIKSVTSLYDRTAENERFRFYGNVTLGHHLSVDDLRQHYHQIVYTTGAQTDRRLDIPGIDLEGSYAATEFVAWYNGHPDFRHCEFDLTQERAAVIGVGNVAMDVARILCRTPEELATTDIADYALEALRESRVREVHILGRRGPVQAAFTAPEVKELGNLAGTDTFAVRDEVELDPLSQAALAASTDRAMARKVDYIRAYVDAAPTGKPRKLHLRFLVSPVELYGDEAGHVVGMRMVHNVLYKTDAGSLHSRATDRFEELPVGLVFRSIGYRGVPLPGIPFNDSWGVILNEKGRVMDPETQAHRVGEYTAGWIKRGPTGVIGTNKPDAAETVECMLADAREGRLLHPPEPSASAVDMLISERQPHAFRYEDWLRIKEIEEARGEELGRPRVKFTSVEEMLAVLERAPA